MYRNRLPLMAVVLFALLAALWGGLLRLGWRWPASVWSGRWAPQVAVWATLLPVVASLWILLTTLIPAPTEARRTAPGVKPEHVPAAVEPHRAQS